MASEAERLRLEAHQAVHDVAVRNLHVNIAQAAIDAAIEAARREGFIEGLTEYAWWKDGEQYVGTCGTRLNDAIRALARGKEGR